MSAINGHGHKFRNVTSEKSFRPPSDAAEAKEFTFIQVGEDCFLATRRPKSWSAERPRQSKEFRGERRNCYLAASLWAHRAEEKKPVSKCPDEWADPEWMPAKFEPEENE